MRSPGPSVLRSNHGRAVFAELSEDEMVTGPTSAITADQCVHRILIQET